MEIKQFKEKYDQKKINEIEKEIRQSNELSLEARKTAIFTLRYLEVTGRYKENAIYRKSSFKEYLIGQFCIRETTYRESFRAFDKFGEASIKYGVGLISKVFRECGTKKERQVIEEIQKAEKASKVPILKSKIETIIQKHAKPSPPAKPGYKTLYVSEAKQHEITKKRLREAVQELRLAKEQIEKLKATILKMKPVQNMMETIAPFFNSKEKMQIEKRAG